MIKVSITETAFFTLAHLGHYMSEFVGDEQALALTIKLVEIAENKISRHPEQFPVCPELDLLGVTEYRQFTLEKYKIIYRFDDLSEIAYVTTFLRHKQSAQELLVRDSVYR